MTRVNREKLQIQIDGFCHLMKNVKNNTQSQSSEDYIFISPSGKSTVSWMTDLWKSMTYCSYKSLLTTHMHLFELFDL